MNHYLVVGSTDTGEDVDLPADVIHAVTAALHHPDLTAHRATPAGRITAFGQDPSIDPDAGLPRRRPGHHLDPRLHPRPAASPDSDLLRRVLNAVHDLPT